MNPGCPFCETEHLTPLAQSDGVLVIADRYPVSRGHALVIPRRHVASFFDLSPTERAEILDLLAAVKSELDREHAPAGYNVGFNDGAAAGQTVTHSATSSDCSTRASSSRRTSSPCCSRSPTSPSRRGTTRARR